MPSHNYAWHSTCNGTVDSGKRTAARCRTCCKVANPAHLLQREEKGGINVFCRECCPCFETQNLLTGSENTPLTKRCISFIIVIVLLREGTKNEQPQREIIQSSREIRG